MAKPELTVLIVEGDLGVYAECPEFGISVGATSRDVAERGLEDLVPAHCETLIRRNGTSGATVEQLALAERVLRSGFSVRHQ